MIILRQKEFNSPARKLIKNRSIINDVSNSRIKSLSTGILAKYNKAKANVLRGIEQTTGLPSLRGKIQKAENLSNPLNAAKKIGRKTKKAGSTLTILDQNPGKVVRSGVAKTAENPIAVIGTAGGWIPTVTSGVVIPGTTEASVALEAAAKRGSKRYNRLTKDLGEKVKTGRLGESIENGVNTVRKTVPLLLV